MSLKENGAIPLIKPCVSMPFGTVSGPKSPGRWWRPSHPIGQPRSLAVWSGRANHYLQLLRTTSVDRPRANPGNGI